MKKIACLFPGIGYTCDKPLLYYSWKLLNGLGWEIVPLKYSGFPAGVKGSAEKMLQCADMALEQTEEQLRDVDWPAYGDVLFIGKSIGTVVCCAYAERHGLNCRRILFTPVEAAFRFADRRSVAFHGTADPWADTEVIKKSCERQGIPLFLTENANHSLETGDVDEDIGEMRKVMRIVRDFAAAEAEK